jgi:hypothetical protein
MTSYSSWGPTLDGRLKPEVVASGHHNGAPNAGITSITVPFGIPTGAANQQDYRVPFSPRTSFWYGWFSQTSNAAAVVSGALALLVDAWRAKYGPAIEPLPSTLRALLVQHAVDISDATAWYNRGPDFASGYGLIDINNTLAGLRRGDARQGLIDVNGVEHITAQVAPGTTTVRFTLAWDDPPAADGASPALINDLDLVVTDPNGVRHYPWTLNAATPSGDAVRTAEDHVNNIEQVFVDAGVVAGTWKIDVRATTIMQGPQTFSVVGRGVSAPNAPTNLRITGLDRF